MARNVLSPAMRKVLENLVAGRRSTDGFASGQSTAGGLTGTFAALYRRGFIERRGDGAFDLAITAVGRAALEVK